MWKMPSVRKNTTSNGGDASLNQSAIASEESASATGEDAGLNGSSVQEAVAARCKPADPAKSKERFCRKPGNSCEQLVSEENNPKVVCSNMNCTLPNSVHAACLHDWETILINYMQNRGRARSWTAAQKKANLWTKKGYEIIYKQCVCDCGGHLRKDMEWEVTRDRVTGDGQKKPKKVSLTSSVHKKCPEPIESLAASKSGSKAKETRSSKMEEKQATTSAENDTPRSILQENKLSRKENEWNSNEGEKNTTIVEELSNKENLSQNLQKVNDTIQESQKTRPQKEETKPEDAQIQKKDAGNDWCKVVSRCRNKGRTLDLNVPVRELKREQVKVLESVLRGYRFLGTITEVHHNNRTVKIMSPQLHPMEVKFSMDNMKQSLRKQLMSKGAKVSGVKAFFYLELCNRKIQVKEITLTSDSMTPQKITGLVSFWDGKTGIITSNVDKISFNEKSSIEGDSTKIQPGLKVNFSLFLNMTGEVHLEAREVILYTDTLKPYHLSAPKPDSRKKEKTNAKKAKSSGGQRMCMASNSHNYTDFPLLEDTIQKRTSNEVTGHGDTSSTRKVNSSKKGAQTPTGASAVRKPAAKMSTSPLPDHPKTGNRPESPASAMKVPVFTNSQDLEGLFSNMVNNLDMVLIKNQGMDEFVKFMHRISKEAPKLEDQLTRILLGVWVKVFSHKGGCRILHTALQHFQSSNKELLAEKLCECDISELSRFFIYGTSAFRLALGILDDNSVAAITSTLAGEYLKMATNLNHYMAVKAIIARTSGTSNIDLIIKELEEEVLHLATDRFGKNVLSGILEYCGKNEATSVQFQEVIAENAVELSFNPTGSQVVISALKNCSEDYQDMLIFKMCQTSARDTIAPMIRLAKDANGHKVVYTMMEVSSGRQSGCDLKKCLLYKQENLMGENYGSLVLDRSKNL